jgi:alanine racemase
MHYGVTATVDLNAIAANYRLLKARAPLANMAGVIKANGYGLGAKEVAAALKACGCKTFYVAIYDEALGLRAAFADERIAVLGGIPPGMEEDAWAKNITPVINDLASLLRMRECAKKNGRKIDIILHVDTGMNRLGLDASEWKTFCENPQLTQGLNLSLVMSHLACSDEWAHPMNRQQLERFKALTAAFPQTKKSFANSCGILLGGDFHFDECRPGRALFGTDLMDEFATKLAPAVRLEAPILMVRLIDSDGSVGYSATQRVRKGARLATLSAGYADGLLRSLSHSDQRQPCHFYLGEHKAPLAGRVSMDLIVIDVSQIPAEIAHPGAMVEIAGPHQTMDALAQAAGTIGYELLTHIAPRVKKVYTPLVSQMQAA